ncbi:M20/M25/M40 family metallo-hydrolase [Candidatus Bipolaricaulota bacterium]|nr:M20/M25/M40 family metallo-hydrolase [Candidatus Bipolaricaulota bacterium]
MFIDSLNHDGLTLFSEMLDIPCPSGHEDRMAAFLSTRLEGMGFSPESDASGNVIVRLDGNEPDRPTICFAAHMDEIGMTVTQILFDGSLRVERLGGLIPWKIGETAVSVIGDGEEVTGMLSMGSGHSRKTVDAGPSWESARILTGRSPQALAKLGIRVGAAAVPAQGVRGPFVFGDESFPWVGAWTFDNRLAITCCLLALATFQQGGIKPRSPLTLVFTVEEEIGCLGAKGFASREKPEVFIAVDGSPLVPECPLQMDGRPAIRSRDGAATYDQRLLQEIRQISATAGVDLQPVVYAGASSDASLVYSIGASPRVACLGYVRESSHGFEVAPLSAFDFLTTTLIALFAQL